MRYIKQIGFVLLAAGALATSCDNNNEGSVQFGPDKQTLTVGPEGSTESVKIAASESWLASTDQAWILISPANGDTSRECKIRIDSTYQDVTRSGEVRFTSAGQTRTVKITQMGFSKQIIVEGAEQGVYNVELPDYAAYGTTFFDVNVTTNVPFTVQIEEKTVAPDGEQQPAGPTADWLTNSDFKLDLVQSKPRTVRIRFNWSYNTKWWKQNAQIRFVPTEETTLTRQDEVAVVQTEAPRITDDRAGDSIAVLAIARQLNVWGGSFDPSKNMLDWGENIELYTKKDGPDKDGKPLEGRVKYVKFFFFDTKAGIPYETRYLTRAEEIIFYGNSNNTSKNIEIGTALVELAKYGYLKKLTLEAYGFNELPAEFVQLGQTLEELRLGSENFTDFPTEINAQNFPNLKVLEMGANRVTTVYDLSNSVVEKPGLGGKLPEYLFTWEKLENLSLQFNYFEGSIPDMKNHPVKWTAEDGYPSLVGKPKILPNAKVLKLNLNRLTGELPEWLLNHPYVAEWSPDIFIFTQEGKDSKGKNAGFSNVPDRVTPPQKEE